MKMHEFKVTLFEGEPDGIAPVEVTYPINVKAPSAEAALDGVWRLSNRVDGSEPIPDEVRSSMVGDVFSLVLPPGDDGEENFRHFLVEMAGFRELSGEGFEAWKNVPNRDKRFGAEWAAEHDNNPFDLSMSRELV